MSKVLNNYNAGQQYDTADFDRFDLVAAYTDIPCGLVVLHDKVEAVVNHFAGGDYNTDNESALLPFDDAAIYLLDEAGNPKIQNADLPKGKDNKPLIAGVSCWTRTTRAQWEHYKPFDAGADSLNEKDKCYYAKNSCGDQVSVTRQGRICVKVCTDVTTGSKLGYLTKVDTAIDKPQHVGMIGDIADADLGSALTPIPNGMRVHIPSAAGGIAVLELEGNFN